ncbi:MAG: hypothetical protein H7123_03540 [Thermoleophilia bacterium]|nr:hypothetical protein [Thermoleophilia bacterium]
MGFRSFSVATAVLCSLVVAAAGCGSSGSSKGNGGDNSSKKPSGKLTGPKGTQVKKAMTEFDKNPKNADACRSLAQSWIAYASPDAPKKAGDTVKVPKDRNASLKKSSETLVKCQALAPKDENVQQMLASTYMAQGNFKAAAPILKTIATARKNDANSWYAYGLAESSAGNTTATVSAWTKFLAFAEAKDPRIKQTKDSIAALKAEATTKAKAATTTTTTKK